MANTYKIMSFDPEGAYDARDVVFLKSVNSGDRSDLFWVRLFPRFEKNVFGTEEPLEIVLLASRHEGTSLCDIEAPMHVYLCTVKFPNELLSDSVDPNNIKILNWAIVEPVVT